MSIWWQICSGREELVAGLQRELEISELLARLLVERGLTEPQQAWKFLNPRVEDLHDPFLLADMERVVERVFLARDRGEKVLIYGDYDVDGITSTVVLRRALEMLGVQSDFHMPRRLEDGYGLQAEVIQRAAEEGYGLVITADSGIRAFEVCSLARELGVDLVVTDHHLPDQELPPAWAIINPKRPDCTYPDKDLAAVGVVFKLVHALFHRAGKESVVPHFLKLVAIGTIADLVPLTGENRIIAKFGLEGLGDPRNVGLKALLEGAGVSREVNQFDVGFKVAPRINAVTRMGGGREVVDLFSVTDEGLAGTIVAEMNAKNLARREQEEAILAEVEALYQEDPRPFQRTFLVVAGRNWHRGVIGIVASRLVERFYRPVLVVSQGDEICQGSGRSIPGFHLLQALDSCRDLFLRYGGHVQAVGCALDPAGCAGGLIEELSRRLDAHARSQLEPQDLRPRIRVESLLRPEILDLKLYREVERLAPFGMGNPEPVFATRRLPVVAGPFVMAERHLKLKVQCNGSLLDAIWWRRAELAPQLEGLESVDAAYVLSRNDYQGISSLQLELRDLAGVGEAPEPAGGVQA